jgi:hypothetical protein
MTAPPPSRTIVVGDVHGCLEELKELLDKVKFQQGTDRLILAGDLTDRGPDTPGVLTYAKSIGAEAVLGNHDEKHLRYRKHRLRQAETPLYQNPMKPFTPDRLEEHMSITDEGWAYLESLPLWLRVCPYLVVVHAGVMPIYFAGMGAVPGVNFEPMTRQKPNDLLRLRYILKRYEQKTPDSPTLVKLKMAQAHHVRDEPENCVLWPEMWVGPDDVIYGHRVVPNCKDSAGYMTTHSYRYGVWTYGIDGGCCFGGQLTAAIVTQPSDVEKLPYDIRFETVQAKRDYAPLRPWEDDPT